MISARLLVFFSLQILCVFGLGNNLVAEWPHVNKNLDWQHEKLNSLMELLETLTLVGNVTLIGWQNVWNTDGSLSEVRMIELTILKESILSYVWSPVDINTYEEIPSVLNMMNTSGNEIITSTSLQQWSAQGDLEQSLYIHGQDVHILSGDGLTILYENVTVSSMAQVQQISKQMNDNNNVGLSILKWNVDGTFNMAESTIVPELISSVVEATNATHQMLTTSLMGISKTSLLHPEDVTKNMVHYMKQNIPGYLWHAVEGSSYTHMSNDVYMSLEYGVINMLEDNVILDIYGVKM